MFGGRHCRRWAQLIGGVKDTLASFPGSSAWPGNEARTYRDAAVLLFSCSRQKFWCHPAFEYLIAKVFHLHPGLKSHAVVAIFAAHSIIVRC